MQEAEKKIAIVTEQQNYKLKQQNKKQKNRI
jgi:hypothetical protein